jgi:hypothetical protein
LITSGEKKKVHAIHESVCGTDLPGFHARQSELAEKRFQRISSSIRQRLAAMIISQMLCGAEAVLMIFSPKCEILNRIQNFSKQTIVPPCFSSFFPVFFKKTPQKFPHNHKPADKSRYSAVIQGKKCFSRLKMRMNVLLLFKDFEHIRRVELGNAAK